MPSPAYLALTGKKNWLGFVFFAIASAPHGGASLSSPDKDAFAKASLANLQQGILLKSLGINFSYNWRRRTIGGGFKALNS